MAARVFEGSWPLRTEGELNDCFRLLYGNLDENMRKSTNAYVPTNA